MIYLDSERLIEHRRDMADRYVLCHYNHNHDSFGRFSTSGAAVVKTSDVGSKEKKERRQKTLAKWFDQNQKVGKDKPPQSRAERVSKESKNIASEISKIMKTIARVRSASDPNLPYNKAKKYSNDELKKKIERLNLEKQYIQLELEKEVVSSGKFEAANVLDTVGSVLAIGASGATIYSLVRSAIKD